jgi:hypothetical protein
MNIKELFPGLYKIRKREYTSVKLARRSGSSHHVHLLRVTGAGERLRYYIDHDQEGIHPSQLPEDYEVLSKYDGPPQIGNCYITISFADSAGEQFTFSVKDTWALRSIFDAMPWLKKPFGYSPRRSVG